MEKRSKISSSVKEDNKAARQCDGKDLAEAHFFASGSTTIKISRSVKIMTMLMLLMKMQQSWYKQYFERQANIMILLITLLMHLHQHHHYHHHFCYTWPYQHIFIIRRPWSPYKPYDWCVGVHMDRKFNNTFVDGTRVLNIAVHRFLQDVNDAQTSQALHPICK